MDFLKRRNDSSSDDSDDEIPPTPAAKSTPLIPPKRFRKQSSSSDSSTNKGRDEGQTPKFSAPVRKPAESDSSSDEDNGPPPAAHHVKVKKEPRDSSSDEDVPPSTTLKSQLINRMDTSNASNMSNRPTHAMSDSDESDNNVRKAVTNQPRRKGDSSDDSAERKPLRSALNHSKIVLKTERPSTAEESSEDDSDNQVAAGSTTKVPLPQAGGDSSSEEEETTTAPQKYERRSETSSEESEDDNPTQSIAVKTTIPAALNHNHNANNESSDSEEEEAATPQQKYERRSDTTSEESEEDNPIQNIAVKTTIPAALSHNKNANNDSSEDTSSEDEAAVSNSLPAHLIHRTANKDSSNEESSEDEEPSSKPTPLPLNQNRNTGNDSSDSESSEDGEQDVKPAISTKPINNSMSKSTHQDSSDNDSSSSEDNARNTTAESNKPAMSKPAYQDSSENDSSDDDSSDGEGHRTMTTATMRASETTTQSKQPYVAPPKKFGASLLKETFKERDRLQAENPLLTIEDLGSDDEIWLIQCPVTMDIGGLKKQHINLAAESEIQLEDGPAFKRFSVKPEQNENKTVNCMLPFQNGNDFQISSLQVKGKVIIQEHIHVPKLRMPEVNVKVPIPLPSGLKVRHPLLGVGFEEQIAQAKKALRESQNYSKKKKSKKKMHDMENSQGEEKVEKPQYNQTLPIQSQSSEKKKKKRDETPFVENHNGINDARNGKMKKDLSHSQDYMNRSESKSADESVQNDSHKKKHKKSKKSSQSEESFSNSSEKEGKPLLPSWHTPQAEIPVSAVDNGDLTSRKKHKKSKKESELISPINIKKEPGEDINGMSTTFINDTSFSKKRKRKDSSHVDTSSDFPVTPAKKKKHSI